MAEPPLLWSFRRCPFAIRARLALAAAGVTVQLREVNLRAKPPELLAVNPRATVPVLELGDGRVLRESLAIMTWALEQRDPEDWLRRRHSDRQATLAQRQITILISANDGAFRHHLNRLRYGGDTSPCSKPSHEVRHRHGQAALTILRGWNRLLLQRGQRQAMESGPGPGRGPWPGPEPEPQRKSHCWLLGPQTSLADMALLPFVRQLRLSDPEGFAAAPGLGAIRAWLAHYEASPLLAQVMAPPLAERQPWRSPQWIYHLALADDWRQAQREGLYRHSTHGLTLEQVGFIHASQAHQISATFRRFYADAGPMRLLTIDPQRLEAAGVAVLLEPAAEGSGELFPHLYGALPCSAVLAAEPYAA